MEYETKLKKLNGQLSKIDKVLAATEKKLKKFRAERKRIVSDIDTLKNERLICEVKASGMTADEVVTFLHKQNAAGKAEEEQK